MGDRTKIEWSEATWTPIRARDNLHGLIGWHCEHVTEGCSNCYAERMNQRLGTRLPFKPGHRKDITIFLDEKTLTQPLRWKRPRMIFVCSMTDLFADFVTDEMIESVFEIMAKCPQHTFQVLTKRSLRMAQWSGPRVLPNVWLGVSAERQEEADERIPHLLQTPAAVRFLSAEPLLASIDLTRVHNPHGIAPSDTFDAFAPWGTRSQLDWVIVGGESGPHARPMHPQWARDLRDQCQAAGVAYFFKQWGEWAPAEYPTGGLKVAWSDQDGPVMTRVGKKTAGRLLDGRTWDEMPR